MPRQTFTSIETVCIALKGHNKEMERNAWFQIEGDKYIVVWED